MRGIYSATVFGIKPWWACHNNFHAIWSARFLIVRSQKWRSQRNHRLGDPSKDWSDYSKFISAACCSFSWWLWMSQFLSNLTLFFLLLLLFRVSRMHVPIQIHEDLEFWSLEVNIFSEANGHMKGKQRCRLSGFSFAACTTLIVSLFSVYFFCFEHYQSF